MNKEYLKNPYYKDTEVKQAKKLVKQFYNKEYTPNLFRTGNLKLASNVAIWDLPSVITYKYKCKDCYAIKAERMYKNTRIFRAFHYELIKEALKDSDKRSYLQDYINVELRRYATIFKEPIVRLHSSGDMFSSKYFDFWIDIINKNKDIEFYTYTKILTNKQIDVINSLMPNFNIVKSMIDDKYINYGSIEYLEDITKVLEAENKEYFICGYGHSDNKLSCMGNCKQCLHCSNVLFVKH